MKLLGTLLGVLLTGVCYAGEAPARPLFDPARHMRVSEVREGMKGYGLTVLKGTKIERFEVEVLSVLRNFNPQRDVILVRCKGANLEHTGSIAGMSGSPIFLKDAEGHERMVGAFAYGWPLMKDPVGGVQPIEYMLDLESSRPRPTTETTANVSADGAAAPAEGRAHWSLSEVVLLPGMRQAPKQYPFAALGTLNPNPRLGADDAEELTRLRPLATPLMAAGLSPHLLREFSPILSAYGLVPLQAGMGGTSANRQVVELEPGSVLAVPLLSGDLDLTAVGTCTEVIGEHVWGFGHAFNNEGPVSLPMGSGQISAVIANLQTSFKLGSLAQVRGALTNDEIVGVAGHKGAGPVTIPIDLHVVYTDGSHDRTYHFNSAVHPRFTPLISGMALASAVSGSRELPQYHTLEMDVNLEFANGQVVHIDNTAVNSSAADLFFAMGTPMIAAANNPFERVMVKKISGTVRVTPEAREAHILSVNVPRSKYRPGETVKAFVTYRPFRAGEAILPIELELPRDLEEGTYQLQISDWQKYLEDEQGSRPFRFTADSSEEVFAVLKEVASIKRNALYIRLTRKEDGVAIGRTAMPHLPSSRRQVLLDAGRSNTTSFVSSTTKSLPTQLVMEGAADFTITIDTEAHVETVGGRGKPERPAAPSASPKSEEKPKESSKPEKTEPAGSAEPQPG